MARLITTQAVNAFMSGKVFNKDNTSVTMNGDFINLKLHNNTIASRKLGDGRVNITNAGWASNTTKERLNGLPRVSVVQRKGVWYLNSQEWDGSWTSV